MDFTLTAREAHFRDRVREFIGAHIRPRMVEYWVQARAEPRWKVHPSPSGSAEQFLTATGCGERCDKAFTAKSSV